MRLNNNFIAFFVVLLILFSVAETFVILQRADQYDKMVSKVVAGVNLTINSQVCGDGKCLGIESCSTCEIDCGACTSAPGGGGGEQIVITKGFDVSKDLFKVFIKSGDVFTDSFVVTNIGDNSLNFDIDLVGLDKLVSLSKSSFALDPGSSMLVNLFFGGVDKEGVYSGEIIIKGDGLQKIIPVIVEVESKKVLFDVALSIPSDYKEIIIPEAYKEVYPGSDFIVYIDLFNLFQIEGGNVRLYYSVIDSQGNIILEDNETMMVEDKVSFTRAFRLPKDIKYGDYVFSMKIVYQDSIGTASDVFSVVREKEKPEVKKDYSWFVFFILSTIIIILWANQRKKLEKLTKN